MPQNGIYVDDDLAAQTYASRLESNDLAIELRQPGELVALAGQIVSERPAAVILDYRLDQHRGDRAESVTYRAGPVAQHMRDLTGEHPDQDFPIVLISSEHNIRDLYRPEKTAHDLFDWKFVKSDVSSSKTAANVLAGLVDGYAVLRQNAGRYSSPAVFGLDVEHSHFVDNQELHEALKDARSPHIAARFILNFLIRRSGLLLSRNDVLARLGIVSGGPEADRAWERLLEPAKYHGAFSGCVDRWWLSEVEGLLSEAFDGSAGRFTAEQRASTLRQRLNVDFTPAQDAWTQRTDFVPALACACCAKPTPLKHSLACLDVGLPSFVLRRRICFNCVQTDACSDSPSSVDDDKDLILDAGDKRVADRIRSGLVSRGDA